MAWGLPGPSDIPVKRDSYLWVFGLYSKYLRVEVQCWAHRPLAPTPPQLGGRFSTSAKVGSRENLGFRVQGTICGVEFLCCGVDSRDRL